MNKKLEPRMSSDKQDWGTPPQFIEWIEKELIKGPIDLDVCAHEDNNKCDRYFTIEDDALSQTWYCENAWMNPPFGRDLPKFIDKAIEEIEEGNARNVWILVPARTDTKWAHRLFNTLWTHQVWLIKGRFNFQFSRNVKGANAPFPSMLIRLSCDDCLKPRHGLRNYIKPLDVPKEARGF